MKLLGYSFDRRGDIHPVYDAEDEQGKNILDSLRDFRGIYATEQEAKNACTPNKVYTGTGPNDFYYD